MGAYLEPLEGGRCRKWNLVVSAGSGRNRRRKSKVFHGTKRQAQDALKEYERNIHIPLETTAFSTFANTWNEARLKSGAIAQATHDKYKWFIRTVTPYLPMPLENIRPSDIQAVYAALNGSWSGTSLKSLHNSLQRIFRAAQDDGLIMSTPMVGIDAPKVDTKEKRALDLLQVTQLLDELDTNDNRQFAVSLILRCGLRRGETLGVEWRDVYDNVLHVRREVTKTDSGVRDIPLDNETMMMIELRRMLVEDALASVGEKLMPTYKLCCGLDGYPLTVNALRRFWDRHKKEYDDFTLHELRHTYLTNLAQAGVHPSVMQRLAGHASMSTTLEIYTHVNNSDLRDAVNLLAKLRQ